METLKVIPHCDPRVIAAWVLEYHPLSHKFLYGMFGIPHSDVRGEGDVGDHAKR